MKRMNFVALALFASAAGSSAHSASQNGSEMLKLSPETRLEQRCDAKAMGIVSREHKGYKAEEFVAYAFADPVIHGNLIKAPGGAIRSGGKWYRLSYTCETSADGLEVKSFAYQLGAEVPRGEWDEHYLVPR
jgi:hypothetical protein